MRDVIDEMRAGARRHRQGGHPRGNPRAIEIEEDRIDREAAEAMRRDGPGLDHVGAAMSAAARRAARGGRFGR